MDKEVYFQKLRDARDGSEQRAANKEVYLQKLRDAGVNPNQLVCEASTADINHFIKVHDRIVKESKESA